MRFLATTCLASLGVLAAAFPALADTTISASTSASLATSTANAGTPDNLIISSGVTISPAGGTAVTIDSNNTVSNAGAISYTDVSNVIGIGASGGLTGTITNSGTITATETYSATDTNGDGVVDGPFAQGTGRYGIRIGGSGSFAGSISDSGSITVKGISSAGIASLVPITGSVTTTGATSVIGDGSYGILLGPVGGTVALAGATSATGAGSIGVALTGDVGGGVVVHAAITSTGYSSTTLPTTLTSLTAGNLLQGGPALSIGGNVAGGVLVAATTTSTDTTLDSDADGIVDSSEGAGTVTSFGSAPGLLVGATTPLTLGPISGGTAGLVINGSVSGSGVYAGFDATALQIGGLGGTVTVTGGIVVAGSVRATANGGNATGLLLGNGALVATLTNSGAIGASSVTTAGGSARAIAIGAGANLASITNSGTISAVVSLAGGPATAIYDGSGTLTQVTSTGTIIASDLNGTARAIDVAANTAGFAYAQAQSSTVTTLPAITGALVTGGGNDVIAASAGTIKSAIGLGAGNNRIALSGTAAFTGSATMGAGNDVVSLADTSSYTGTIDFGGAGADELDLAGSATFTGQLLNTGSNVALSILGGTATFTNTGAVALRSLALSGGTLGVTINPATGDHTQLVVAGNTTIGAGSTIKVALTSIGLQGGTYTVLTSGTLGGSANLGLSFSALPFLVTGSLAASDAAGTVAVNLQRKTAAQLGFTRSEAQAYDGVYAQIATNPTLTGLFLALTDQASTIQRYRQLLPDHAGGVFDLMTQGSRLLEPGDNTAPWANLGGVNLWAQQAALSTHQQSIETPGYRGSFWGLSAGADLGAGDVGRFGISTAFVFGNVKDSGTSNEVTSNLYEVGPYWAARWGGLRVSARGAAGLVSETSRRTLASTSSTSPELASAHAHWTGLLLSASGKLSYEAHLGPVYLRPGGTISYYRLREGAHDENEGGTAIDLSIATRRSDEAAAAGTLALGVQLGAAADPEALVTRVEVEGGRRAIVGGTIGSTTAHFAGGSSFTLDPEDRTGGYIGTLRVSIGSQAIRLVASGSYETRDGYHEVVGRVGVRGAF